MAFGIQLAGEGILKSDTYGRSAYKLYEAWSSSKEFEEPAFLLVWLHGQGTRGIQTKFLQRIQRRLGRRAYILVPLNPDSKGGITFDWGVRYTKAENRNGWGYIFGHLCEPYLKDLLELVQETRSNVGASRTILMGYSMGGFGVLQLAGISPETFDAAVCIAGYGLGTFCTSVPQPGSGNILNDYLKTYAPQLAKVPHLVAIHARGDQVSLFSDVETIVGTVRQHGSKVELVVVPDNKAVGRSKHDYFNFALVNDSSEFVLYRKLRAELNKDSVESKKTQEELQATMLLPAAISKESTLVSLVKTATRMSLQDAKRELAKGMPIRITVFSSWKSWAAGQLSVKALDQVFVKEFRVHWVLCHRKEEKAAWCPLLPLSLWKVQTQFTPDPHWGAKFLPLERGEDVIVTKQYDENYWRGWAEGYVYESHGREKRAGIFNLWYLEQQFMVTDRI